MTVFVTGGSASGKSAYAETRAEEISGGGQKYYVATMRAFGEEGEERVKKHRARRAGKGFLTIEQPVSVWKAAEAIEALGKKPGEGTALLECVPNLVANEMFGEGEAVGWEEASGKALAGIARLGRAVQNLIVVTGQVFEDGARYEASVEAYRKALGAANRGLAKLADEAVEVVAGIPVMLKRQE